MSKHYATFATLFLSFVGGLAYAQPGVTLFDRDHLLNFDHRCSEPRSSGYPFHRALALFENPAAPASGEVYEGLVLANVRVGWIAGVGGANGVGVDPANIRLELPNSWHGDEFGLALKLTDLATQTAVTGVFATEFYRSAPNAEPTKSRYRASSTGQVDWARWSSVSSADKNRAGEFFSYSMPIDVAARNIMAQDHAQQLELVLRNGRNEAQLTLEGPVLDDLVSLLAIEKPSSRTLGPLATLNPFQRGSLWNWLGDGWRYRKCHELDALAEREFNARAGRLADASG